MMVMTLREMTTIITPTTVATTTKTTTKMTAVSVMKMIFKSIAVTDVAGTATKVIKEATNYKLR